ncbi:transposase [candidate division KSB1 bacterium]|nr:transposase [candidate division KSB1 bacterium]
MPRRLTRFVAPRFYHIFNRGIDRQIIFPDHLAYQHFVELWKIYSSRFRLTTVAYCLMPNHFHFLIQVNRDHTVSKCLGCFLDAYVRSTNRRTGRTGSMFADRFKDVQVDREGYLIYLCRYIHLNPIKADLVADLRDWPHSNCLEYLGLRWGELYSPDFMRAYFRDAREYAAYLQDERKLPQDFDRYRLD